jgi:hypothetical protein
MSRKTIVTIDYIRTKKWRDQCGRYHRLDGPAQEHICGDKYWYKHGKLHRIDSPAIHLSNGYSAWYIENKRHREDGPAVIFGDGDKEWWLDGVFYQTKEFFFDTLSDEAKMKCLFSEDFLNG